MRVEFVHPANRDRHALLQQLCTDRSGPQQLPGGLGCGEGLGDQLVHDDAVLQMAQCSVGWMWPCDGHQSGDGTAVDRPQLTMPPQQPAATEDSSCPQPLEQFQAGIGGSVAVMSLAYSMEELLCAVRSEGCSPSSGCAAGDGRQLSSLSAMSYSSDSVSLVSRCVTAPVTRSAADRGQSSPQLCPTTPPLPQPSPFVLSTGECELNTDGAEAAAAGVAHTPASARPVRICAVHCSAVTAKTTAPAYSPSPVLFPRQLPSDVAAALLDAEPVAATASTEPLTTAMHSQSVASQARGPDLPTTAIGTCGRSRLRDASGRRSGRV